MDGIGSGGFQKGSDLHCFLNAAPLPAWNPFTGADAADYRKFPAAGLFYGRDNITVELAASQIIYPVFIRPVIIIGRKELSDFMGMSAVQFHSVKPRLFCGKGAARVALRQFENIVLFHVIRQQQCGIPFCLGISRMYLYKKPASVRMADTCQAFPAVQV